MMDDNTLLRAIKKGILDAVQREAEYLADGKAGTLEEYKKRSGVIAGLKESLVIIKTAIGNMNASEEEEI